MYLDILMNEGKRDHIDMKKLIERAMYKAVGITVGCETGEAERKKNLEKMPTAGVEFGFPIIPMGYPEAIHFEKGYQ